MQKSIKYFSTNNLFPSFISRVMYSLRVYTLFHVHVQCIYIRVYVCKYMHYMHSNDESENDDDNNSKKKGVICN